MGKHKVKEGILLLNDHMKLAEKLLTESERGRLYTALRRYSMEGVITDFTSETSGWVAVFEMMRSAQDKANQLYEETCERNRLRVLKRYADATGGSSGSQSYQSNQNKTNQIKDLDPSSLRGVEETGVTGVVWL